MSTDAAKETPADPYQIRKVMFLEEEDESEKQETGAGFKKSANGETLTKQQRIQTVLNLTRSQRRSTEDTFREDDSPTVDFAARLS